MLKLYGIRAGSSLRNHWLLSELDVPYEEVNVDLRAREHKQEAFLQLNPSGQVPVLADGDFILCESMAINNYLAEKFRPEMLGTTIEERANAWRWSIWSYLNIQKHFGTIWYQTFLVPEKDQTAIDKAVAEIKPYLSILDKHLSDKKYLIGENFSVADINAGVAVGYGVAANFDLTAYPNVARWYEILAARPAFIKATSKA